MSEPQFVAIPPTTHFTVVFPYNQNENTFDSGFYSPFLTDGRAHLEEINRVLKEIETVLKPFTKKIVQAIICFITTIFLALAGFLYFMICIAAYNNDLIVVGVISFAGTLIFSAIYILMTFYNSNKKSRVACQAVIDRANQQAFNHRGLRWHLPVHFPKWVELWKDYYGQGQGQGQGQMGTQPVYIPPVNQQPYAGYGENSQPQYQNNYNQGYQNNNGGYVPLNEA